MTPILLWFQRICFEKGRSIGEKKLPQPAAGPPVDSIFARLS
jgi:hypothetical protein